MTIVRRIIRHLHWVAGMLENAGLFICKCRIETDWQLPATGAGDSGPIVNEP